jgi:hypothetical protein
MKKIAVLACLLFAAQAHAQPKPNDPQLQVVKLRVYLDSHPSRWIEADLKPDMHADIELPQAEAENGHSCLTFYNANLSDQVRGCSYFTIAQGKFDIPDHAYASMEPPGWVNVVICPEKMLHDHRTREMCLATK